jgi:hypothetical protein
MPSDIFRTVFGLLEPGLHLRYRMDMTSNASVMKVLVAGSYLFMVTVNALANILPINGITTGSVSDSYPNLFAPAGITFSIWGLIYLFLGVYTVSRVFRKETDTRKGKALQEINLYFITSSVLNGLWIFAWHYRFIGLTVVLMVALLLTLIRIADLVNSGKFSLKDRAGIKIPFGIYFGWITIATIANITVYLVSIGWNGFGIPESVWMTAVLLTGVVITCWRMWKDGNIAYGLVPVWAYSGIWLKHISPDGFDSRYPSVITVLILSLVVLSVFNLNLIYRRRYL